MKNKFELAVEKELGKLTYVEAKGRVKEAYEWLLSPSFCNNSTYLDF